MEFNRDDVKKSFLSRILYRMDYVNLANIEIEKILVLIKKSYKGFFERYDIETNNQINITLKNIENQEFDIEKTGENLFHVFYGIYGKIEYLIKISNSCAYLEVLPKEDFKDFFHYSRIFNNIIEQVRRSVGFFSLKRIGLRKFNHFYIKAEKVNMLNKVFNGNAFALWTPEESKLNIKRNIYSFLVDNYGINVINEIELVQTQKGEQLYEVKFDFDINTKDEKLLNEFIIDIDKNTEYINNMVFKYFINYFDTKFLEEVVFSEEPGQNKYGIVGV